MLPLEIGMYGSQSVDKANHPQPQNHRKAQTVTQNQQMEPPNSMFPTIADTPPALFGHGHYSRKGGGAVGVSTPPPHQQTVKSSKNTV